MEKLIVLGTGNAQATHCYNTCFALTGLCGNDREYLLTDAGGGNGILVQLEKAGIPLTALHHIIVTHEHCDHVLGIIWMVRMIATLIKKETYEGILHLYCHEQLARNIQAMCSFTLQKKLTDLFGSRILFHFVDKEPEQQILGCKVSFFSILSGKALQYGFCLPLSGNRKLTCLGDEPLNENCGSYIEASDWVLSEAFCLFSERDRFKPYEKNHSTVKDACEMGTKYRVANLVLWHTEDKDLLHRKERYLAEGSRYYSGNLFIPDDLEEIVLA